MLLEKGMVSYWRSKPVMDFTVMGLVPMLPSTEVAPVLVMPDLVSRQKFSVVPRLMTARTGHGACGGCGGGDGGCGGDGGDGGGDGGDGGDDGEGLGGDVGGDGGEGLGGGGEGDDGGGEGDGGGGATIVVSIRVTSVCANPRPLSEAPAVVVIAVLHKMMPSACASAPIVATPATCQKMLLALAPFWRTTFESAMKLSPSAICMIHTVSSSPSASK